MSLRAVVLVIVLVVAALATFAWINNQQRPEPMSAEPGAAEPSTATPPEASDPPGEDPGMTWITPKRWIEQPARPMRLVTYAVASGGAKSGAECVLYYFGEGQGGGTEENLQRWIGEFDSPQPERSTKLVDGMPVARLRVRGAQHPHGAAMETSQIPEFDHELIGAIVEGPHGSVFFKLTGPRQVVDAAAPDFDRMLDSVRKH
jgi:hypothetical protein